MKQAYLEAGQIINTHGIAGAVKIRSWCDSPSVFAALKTLYFRKGEEYVPVKVTKSSVLGKFVVTQFEGVNTFDEANALRNKILFAARGDLPLGEGDCFIADLKGLPVIDADTGRIYGTLRDVDQSSRHDLYVIETDAGEVLFPAVKEFVDRVDPEEGIFIRPIEGFFGSAEEEK